VLQYRVYLVYVAVTYPFLRPYMKSILLSVESYRETKDKDGWERHLIKSESDPAIEFAREERNIDLDPVTLSDAPLTVKFVPQVELDIKSMQRLTNLPSPIMVLL
jgi:hypothetical protein